jgi:hypothetical protein
LLLGPVREVVDAGAVVAGVLHLSRPRNTYLVVGGQGRGQVSGGPERGDERRRVLDGLSGALGEEGQHRVRGVAEEGNPSVDVLRQRWAIEDRPATDPGDRVEQDADFVVPSGELGAEVRRRALGGPRLDGLAGRGGGECDDVHRVSCGDRVMHQMPSGTEPEALCRHQVLLREIARGDKGPPGAQPRVAGRDCADDLVSDRRVDAVGGDDQVAAYLRAVGEGEGCSVRGLVEPDAAAAEVDGGGVDCGEQGVEEVGAVDEPGGLAVEALAAGHVPGEEHLPVCPAAELPADLDLQCPRFEVRHDAEAAQQPDGVRSQHDPRPDRLQLRCLLVDVRVDTLVLEEGRGRQTADAPADDDDVHGIFPVVVAEVRCSRSARSCRRRRAGHGRVVDGGVHERQLPLGSSEAVPAE